MRGRTTLLLPLALVVVVGCASSSASTTPITEHGPDLGSGHPVKASSFADWPNFHRTAAKTGHVSNAVKPPLHRAWTAALDGAVWSEPVIGGGILIAATEHDTVYGLNPTTGKQIWHQHLGTPEPLSAQPCGDINPIGITGSPAYDAATGSVFAVTTTGAGRHTLWALNARTGHKRWHRNVDVAPNRDSNAEQQRAALLVIDRRVIVTFGAHDGDCGNYVGYAASVATSGHGTITHYAVPNARGSGMWGPAGPVEALDGNLLTPTANGSKTSGTTWDHSDGVIELNPTTMHFVRGWAPSNWKQGNADDQSLGSTSPVRVAGKYVVGGKRGTVWLLKPDLGGVGGELDSTTHCQAFGGAAAAGHTVILPCKYPSANMFAVTVKGNTLVHKWQTAGVYGSPIIAGKRVYVADLGSGTLKVLSLATGKVTASIAVGRLPTFPSEVVDGDHVFVPTLAGITAIRGS